MRVARQLTRLILSRLLPASALDFPAQRACIQAALDEAILAWLEELAYQTEPLEKLWLGLTSAGPRRP